MKKYVAIVLIAIEVLVYLVLQMKSMIKSETYENTELEDLPFNHKDNDSIGIGDTGGQGEIILLNLKIYNLY